jgi:arylsulfatase
MRPNLVVLLPDQLRPDFLSCYGARFVSTPAIDSIAATGVRFTSAFSSSPICVPARTAMLTGMHPMRTGVLNHHYALRPDYREVGMTTWADELASAGYHTAAVGKMHFHPWDAHHGFHHRVIAEDKRLVRIEDDYHHYLRRHGLRKISGPEYDDYQANLGAVVSTMPYEHTVDRFVGSAACGFIRTQPADEPFALFVGPPSPHDPYDPDPRFLDDVDTDRLPRPIPRVPGHLDSAREAQIRARWAQLDLTDFLDDTKLVMRHHYAALVRQLDVEVGRILDTLVETGADDHTVVILASDHGDYLGDHDYFGKGTFFDGSVRIPLLVRVPGMDQAVVSDALVDLYDLAPTLLTLAGLEVPAVMDAVPLPHPVVPDQPPRRQIFGALDDGWMLVEDDYKLHRYLTGEVLLHDRRDDPGEQRNLATSPRHHQQLSRMESDLWSHAMRTTVSSHDDNLAAPTAGQGDFYRAGWRRGYPARYRPLPDSEP